MPVPSSEILSLLRLLDDDNPTVRAAVKRKLASYGEELEQMLAVAAPELGRNVREQAFALQKEYEGDAFLERWKSWLLEPSGMEKLETGQCLLASYLMDDREAAEAIPAKLDELAVEFQDQYVLADFRNLATFLFRSGRFKGDSERYYHPDNSNFARVLESRRGNPISLACVFILTGLRAGLAVGGCNYPAHFLARARCERDGLLYLVDCFNEGKIIPAADLIRHHPLSSREVKDVVEHPATAEITMARVLRNLDNAFARMNRPNEQAFVRRLWQTMNVA